MATSGSQPQSILTTDQAALLADWERKKQVADLAIGEERTARLKCFGAFFASPVEGTNSFGLSNGYTLKGKLPINRKVLPEELEQLKAVKLNELPPGFLQKHNLPSTDMPAVVALRIDLGKLVVYKPEVAIKEYRSLTADQLALFDRCLEIKPGMAGLEIAEPSERAKVALAAGN